MPSSSRKKNKGRDRKAKKAEAERVANYNTWQVWATATGEHVQCSHGLEATIPDISHPVSSFISEYFFRDNIRDTLQAHEEVWNNDNHRKLARDILVRISATHLLDNEFVRTVTQNTHLDGVSLAWGLTTAILILENYDEMVSCSLDHNYSVAKYSRIVASKDRDLGERHSSKSKRDVIKFYRKRMKCSCLKKIHLETRKTMPKMGKCHHCGVVKERELLMVCSRCMIDQYCSRKCQVTASPGHRSLCDVFVKAHDRTMANDSS